MSPFSEAGLGRYSFDDDGGRRFRVELLGLPVQVLRAAREHHDGLMRELRLMALQEDVEPGARALLTGRVGALVDALGSRHALVKGRRETEVERALRDGVLVIDQVDEVPARAEEALQVLSGLIEEADRLAADAQLVTLPRPPLLVAFTDWYLGQYAEQVRGGPPRRWTGAVTVA